MTVAKNASRIEQVLPAAVANAPLKRPDDEGAELHAEREADTGVGRLVEDDGEEKDQGDDGEGDHAPNEGQLLCVPPPGVEDHSAPDSGQSEDGNCEIENAAGAIAPGSGS